MRQLNLLEDAAPHCALPTAFTPRAPEHFAVERIILAARDLRPDLEVGLCLEDTAVWETVGQRWGLGRCNCIL